MYITHFNTQSTNDTYCMLRMIRLMKSTMPFIEYVYTWLMEITLGWVLCKASNDLYSYFLYNFISQKIYYHVYTIITLYTKFHDILRYHFIPLINGLKPCSNIFILNHIILTKDILRWCINQKTLKCRIMTEDGAITYFSRIIAIFRIELMDVHFSIQNQWRMK